MLDRRGNNARCRWLVSTGVVYCIAAFSLLLMPVMAVVALVLCVLPVIVRHDWELLVAGILVIGGLFVACFHVTRSLLTEVRSALPEHPDTSRNAHLLPAEETLMRAADLPDLHQRQLLRPVRAEVVASNELMRAFPIDARDDQADTFGQIRNPDAVRDLSTGRTILRAPTGFVLPMHSGQATPRLSDGGRRAAADEVETD